MTDRREAYNALMKFYPLTLDDLPDEIWRPIKRYEDFYHVSNYGRVKSFHKGKVRILKPQADKDGYISIALQAYGAAKLCRIHRLVAEAFIPNTDDKPEINHVDGHPLNNHVSNLEWCTRLENQRHAANAGLYNVGELHSQAKLTNADAKYIRDNPNNLTGNALAEMFGVDATTISLVQCGKTFKDAGGTIRKVKIKPPRVPNDVRNEIRRLYVRGSREFGSTALAEKFGLHQSTVWDIIHEEAD